MKISNSNSFTGLRIQAMDDETVIWVYGDIGQGPGMIDAKEFQTQLDMLGETQALTIRINSSGGEVSEVLAIHAILAKFPGTIRVEIDGFALSAASLLAMIGNPVVMAENALLMIHAPWSGSSGNAVSLRKSAEALDMVAEQMIKIYAAKTGLPTKQLEKIMAEETWLNAEEALKLGFCDEISEAQRIAASFDLTQFNVPKRYKELTMKTEANNPESDTIKAAVLKAEGERRTEIRTIFGAHAQTHADLLDECLDNTECDAGEASKVLLKALGSNTVPVGSVIRMDDSRRDEFKAAATDALLMRYGVQVKDPSPAAADLRNTSILSMAESCLSMMGRSVTNRNPDKILAAAGTSDFPYLLSGVAEKALMHGFDSEPASHKAWVKTVDVTNFKEIQRVQRSEAPGLEHVPELGEYKFGTFGERKEVYQVLTYGKMFGISRQALINDDLGAFTTTPAAFGASARRLEADQVYAILTDNAAMADGIELFHSDHKNISGSSQTIDFSSLGAARSAMRRQRGANGAILNIVPRYLIVPATLETQAETMLASIAKPGQENSGVANAQFIRSLELVVDPRLDEISESEWYLAGSTDQVDTVELAYLNGQRGIDYLEQEGWNIDALEVKARLDFGTKAIDWRGLYKVGAAAE